MTSYASAPGTLVRNEDGRQRVPCPGGRTTLGPVSIAERFAVVTERVAAAARAAHRDPAEVQILAAVKTQTPERIAELIDVGATLLGHNRAQELTELAPALAVLRPGAALTHHFIGQLQTNKAARVVDLATCVHSVDRRSLATKLSALATQRGRTLDVFVQVNASGEETKAGVQPDDALQFALDVAALPSLHVRGLMTIGANSPDPAVVNAAFAVMQELSSTVGRSGLDAPELSMGMSSDLEAAIAHGATMVRLGTDIFGPRV